eukprot:scaffold1953_cov391-Prasinococcus_capsulatus_cf.AAC.6
MTAPPPVCNAAWQDNGLERPDELRAEPANIEQARTAYLRRERRPAFTLGVKLVEERHGEWEPRTRRRRVRTDPTYLTGAVGEAPPLTSLRGAHGPHRRRRPTPAAGSAGPLTPQTQSARRRGATLHSRVAQADEP